MKRYRVRKITIATTETVALKRIPPGAGGEANCPVCGGVVPGPDSHLRTMHGETGSIEVPAFAMEPKQLPPVAADREAETTEE